VTGLVGAVTRSDVKPMLVEGLLRLGHGSHDLAGIALLHGVEGRLDWRRSIGPVSELERRLHGVALSHAGFANTRGPPDGVPVERDAPPQVSHGTVAAAHCGEITNARVARAMLEAKGYDFATQTDSEVIAHLVHDVHKKQRGLLNAMRELLQTLDGRYAIAAVAAAEPDRLVVGCHGSTLVIGIGADGQWVASSAAALLPWTRRCIFLAPGDVAELEPAQLTVVDRHGHVIIRTRHAPEPEAESAL
jgi:glucosamine--fructose-6-phosphate aminotransferase (isomerizing)